MARGHSSGLSPSGVKLYRQDSPSPQPGKEDRKGESLVRVDKLSGARVLGGRFASVQQAIDTAKGNLAAAAFIRQFIEEAKTTGLVEGLITRHNVEGPIAAPAVE